MRDLGNRPNAVLTPTNRHHRCLLPRSRRVLVLGLRRQPGPVEHRDRPAFHPDQSQRIEAFQGARHHLPHGSQLRGHLRLCQQRHVLAALQRLRLDRIEGATNHTQPESGIRAIVRQCTNNRSIQRMRYYMHSSRVEILGKIDVDCLSYNWTLLYMT